MAKTITVDPLTRIEGHLSFQTDVEGGRVRSARLSGEMFRGFEIILKNRHPMDAQQITQRICGVCPISHGIASVLAQDMAYKVTPPKNGRLVRNLILGANYIQSHIIHFYHLSALDFIDITAVLAYSGKEPDLVALKSWVKAQLADKKLYPAAPFLPRYASTYASSASLNISGIRHYVQGLEMRTLAHEAAALFAGKLPHAMTIVPGGVTEKVTANNIASFAAKLDTLRTFINECYIPDVIGVAKEFNSYFDIGKGCQNYLSYGVFEEDDNGGKMLPAGTVINGKYADLDPNLIAEYVGYSKFSSSSGLHPEAGKTVPEPHKEKAYSWLKAPRYNGHVMEVGPLARFMVAYKRGDKNIKKVVDSTARAVGISLKQLDSVMGRHAVRAIEAQLVADRCTEWLNMLTPGSATYKDFKLPDTASGYGLTEAPRGALGHWITVKGGRIDNYQCVVPTTWNCSPRDDEGNPGCVEIALEGTPVKDSKNPIEAARVVRSFDPCMACAVH